MESVSVGGTDDFSWGIGKQADKASDISETCAGFTNLDRLRMICFVRADCILNKISHHKITFIN